MSTLNILSRLTFTLILAASFQFTQGQSTRIPPIDSGYPGGTLSNSFLSSNRLQFKQGLTFTTSSGRGISSSAGIYSNSMTYQVSDKLQINTGFNLVSPMNNGIVQNQKPAVDFNIGIDYKPYDNLNFKLEFIKVNSENLYLYHRMGNF